ncbi:MAG TPA: hypothetical protein VEA41_10130, partial [Salinarimonas sp.]|nr:hypothetical protein [Salinarimonas sp.]
GVGAVLAARRPRAAHPGLDRAAAASLVLAAGVFALSLLFRTVDQAVCAALPTGTHALWHGLNAVVLYVLLRGAIRHRAGLAGVTPARGRH